MVVVSVRQHGCELVPVFLVLVNVIAQHRQDLPVVALHLPIRLGVVCRRKDIRYSKQLAHCLEELSSELLSVIRDDALRAHTKRPSAQRRLRQRYKRRSYATVQRA